jgi:hypothetical protein
MFVIPKVVRECSNHPLDEVDAKNKEIDRTHEKRTRYEDSKKFAKELVDAIARFTATFICGDLFLSFDFLFSASLLLFGNLLTLGVVTFLGKNALKVVLSILW